jgi:hypothetical protein
MEFDRAGGPLRSTDFQCDSEGRCIGWTGFDSSGGLTRRCVQQYAGKLLVSSATSDAKGMAIRQEDFEYVASDLVKSVCRYYGPDGTLCETWTSHHDTQGRLIETFGLAAEGALWETEDTRTNTTRMVEKSRLGALTNFQVTKFLAPLQSLSTSQTK